jgi:hypothetical protein
MTRQAVPKEENIEERKKRWASPNWEIPKYLNLCQLTGDKQSMA